MAMRMRQRCHINISTRAVRSTIAHNPDRVSTSTMRTGSDVVAQALGTTPIHMHSCEADALHCSFAASPLQDSYIHV